MREKAAKGPGEKGGKPNRFLMQLKLIDPVRDDQVGAFVNLTKKIFDPSNQLEKDLRNHYSPAVKKKDEVLKLKLDLSNEEVVLKNVLANKIKGTFQPEELSLENSVNVKVKAREITRKLMANFKGLREHHPKVLDLQQESDKIADVIIFDNPGTPKVGQDIENRSKADELSLKFFKMISVIQNRIDTLDEKIIEIKTLTTKETPEREHRTNFDLDAKLVKVFALFNEVLSKIAKLEEELLELPITREKILGKSTFGFAKTIELIDELIKVQ